MPKKYNSIVSLKFLYIFIVSLLISMCNVNLYSLNTNFKLKDTTAGKDSEVIDDFLFSNSKRYTMTGRLPNAETEIRTKEAWILGGAFTVILGGQHYLQATTIYKENTNFRFMEDGAYAYYVDKAGHLYAAYIASYIFSESLITVGFSPKSAGLWGGLMGLGYETYIEIMDGYGKNWGFSMSDYYLNIAGASLFLGQNYIDGLQNFIPKYTYIPADLHGENRRIPSDIFVDDYSSQTYWISINVHGLLPKSIDDYWPKWLNLSVGYATRNLTHIYDPSISDMNVAKLGKLSLDGDNYGNPKYILALDYNLVELIPKTDYPFVNWLVQTLNYVKWPAPAIEFGQETKFMLMYPFLEF